MELAAGLQLLAREPLLLLTLSLLLTQASI